jgi:hypothetical protein
MNWMGKSTKRYVRKPVSIAKRLLKKLHLSLGTRECGHSLSLRRRSNYASSQEVCPRSARTPHTACVAPVSSAFHGYDIQGFLRPEPRFASAPGKEEDELRELLDEAYARGLYVIFDIVLNHVPVTSLGTKVSLPPHPEARRSDLSNGAMRTVRPGPTFR